MIESFRTALSRRARAGTGRVRSGFAPAAVSMLTVALLAPEARAQSPSASSAPSSDPAAAVGMTSGLDSRVSSRDAEMMQIRAAAQSARGEAAQASMARSADRSIEEQQRRRALEEAREEKAIKRQMANRMEWERASDAYQKVTADEMASWRTQSGNVRVERNVPDAFLVSLIEQEERLAEREAAAAAEEEQGFSPLRATKKALGWRPWKRSETASAEMTASDSGGGGGVGGMISSLNPVRLISGGGDSSPERREPRERNASAGSTAPGSTEPRFVRTSSSSESANRGARPAPSSSSSSARATGAAARQPGAVPRISGAALVDGGESPVNRSEPESGGASSSSSADRPPQRSPRSQQRQPSFAGADEMPAQDEGSGGFFSFLSSDGGSDSSGGGGGLFGFGKKKEPSRGSAGSIDASLFPAGSSSGASTSQNYDAAPSQAQTASASAGGSSSTVELPGQSGRSQSRSSSGDSGFSFPSFGGSDDSDGGSTSRSGGSTGYYVVTSPSQFMQYGADRMQSEVRAVPAGTLLRVTRPGERWAGVRLSNGSEGVIENDNLRAASASEIGGGFATGE